MAGTPLKKCWSTLRSTARYLLLRMPKPSRKRVKLSPREQEIVRMVAKGHPNKVIADVLNISSWTVCTQVQRMADRFLGSRAGFLHFSNHTNPLPPILLQHS